MSPEKTNLLKEKYPKIFSEHFYFECNDGWFNLIDTACHVIQGRIDLTLKHYEKNFPELLAEKTEQYQLQATQIKEKFGTMRFHYFGGDSYIEGIVDYAEKLSERICEMTGAVGSLHSNNGWQMTVSDDYANAHNMKKVGN